MSNLIRLIVADDHPIVREGLVSILSTQQDFEVIAEAGDGTALIQQVEMLDPDVILIDLEMPRIDGVEAIQRIRAFNDRVQFIAFTAFDTDERIVSAVQAGARGYLLKGAPRDEIFKAIRTVSAGGSLLEPAVASKLLEHISGRTSSEQTEVDPLTEREMEVLLLLAKGMKNKQIAAELFITERTVKFYVSAILSKLGASNRTEAVTLAAGRGLIQL